jgi:CLIP-associating protein 1/2
LERATTSKDSGISNMADVEERMEGLALSNSVIRKSMAKINCK